MSKRVKISFQSVNEGRITVLDPQAINDARKRIAAAMEIHIRSLNKRKRCTCCNK